MDRVARFLAERPWLQFGLVALLIVSWVSLMIYWVEEPLREQRRVSNELEGVGASVSFRSPEELYFDTGGWGPVTDDVLERIRGLARLKKLGLVNTQITDAGLEHLKGLSNLKMLLLNGTQVTGPGLEHLKGLTRLEQLELDNTQISDAGLAHLKGLTSLRFLSLRGTQVSEEGVKKLQQSLPNCMISH